MVNCSGCNKRTAATIGFGNDLWPAVDALRSNIGAAEYKHVVLGLIFLKHISDAFEEYHARLEAERTKGADPEDPNECRLNTSAGWPGRARSARRGAEGAGLADRSRRLALLPPDRGRSACAEPSSIGSCDVAGDAQAGDETKPS